MITPLWFRPWMAWAAAVAVMAALLGLQTVRLADERTAHANAVSAFNAAAAKAEREARQAVEDARTEERRRTDAVQEIANEAQSKLDQALADAGVARSAGERLRERIAQLTAACRAAASNPGAASSGAPAEATADLLADVQRRLDEAADGIAGFADKSAAAGKACERSYDALTTRPAGGLGLKR